MFKLVIFSTFIGASRPFKEPRTSLVAIAIQYSVLSPNSVLNMTLEYKES